jgi:hypothetical protein
LPGGQGGGFATVAHPQLAQDVGDVIVDGAGTDEQLRGNLRICQVQEVFIAPSNLLRMYRMRARSA